MHRFYSIQARFAARLGFEPVPATFMGGVRVGAVVEVGGGGRGGSGDTAFRNCVPTGDIKGETARWSPDRIYSSLNPRDILRSPRS